MAAAEAGLEASGRGEQHVLTVVGARHGQGIGGHQGRWPPWALVHHLVAFNPQVGPEPGGQAITLARCDPEGVVPGLAVGPEVGVVAIEDPHRAALQQAAFDGAVVGQGAVALQVVGREGGPDADLGGQLRCRLDLVTAEFHHHPGRQHAARLQPLQHQLGG